CCMTCRHLPVLLPFSSCPGHRVLHSFPTRRSSDLFCERAGGVQDVTLHSDRWRVRCLQQNRCCQQNEKQSLEDETDEFHVSTSCAHFTQCFSGISLCRVSATPCG